MMVTDSEEASSTSTSTAAAPPKYKPNKELTVDERKAKRQLKNQLKAQQKRGRLETRLRHAQRRNDARTEQETRLALQAFADEGSASSESAVCSLSKEVKTEEELPHRSFLLQFCGEIQRRQPSPNGRSKKQCQTQQAVTLLRHMTKGTQSRGMFQDEDALWGYTRQKFFERALLVCTSFLKLQPQSSPPQTRMWKRLQSARSLCSIGCGPGNDALGVVAFRKALDSNKSDPRSPLDRAILLDWAMDDWKVILEPLCDIAIPKYINRIETCSCDVTKAFTESSAVEKLLVDDDGWCSVDLFLISYLLTEIREQWHAFVKDMVTLSKPSTLFYFAEPTPWQLHTVIQMFDSVVDFCWLDSSMNKPELQALDNRVGPGVLLGLKR